MTSEQQKDAERLERYVVREGLSSVMNDTKWREALDALQGVTGYIVRFRVKDVRGPEPRPGYWDRDFPYNISRPYKNIEWFEVNPLVERSRGALLAPDVEDFTGAIVMTFQSKGIPYHHERGVIRIRGYTRPSQPAV